MGKSKLILLLFLISFGTIVLRSQSLTTRQVSSIETSLLKEMKEARIPGIALAIINNNKIVYEKYFGVTNSVTETPLTDSTIFQVASITKIFTSLALLTELKKAKISVNEPIGDLIKGLSTKLSQLTYHQLLTHTSGLIDYVPSSVDSKIDAYTFFKIHGDSLLFAEPKTIFSYSNTGYALVGLALETLCKKKYTVVIQDIIINPLKLTSTTFDFNEVTQKSYSFGHIYDSDLKKMLPSLNNFEPHVIQPAAGIFSTIRDLEKLALCLMNDGESDGKMVFDKEIIEKMSTRYAINFAVTGPSYEFQIYPDNAYGYGLVMYSYGRLRLSGHIGSGSQLTYFMYEPKRKFALIMISNRQADYPINTIKEIFKLVLNEKGSQLKMPFENKSEWAEITGNYVLHTLEPKNENSLEISETEGMLYIRFINKEKVVMQQIGYLTYQFPESTLRFPFKIAFYPDKSGKVKYLRYQWRTWEKTK